MNTSELFASFENKHSPVFAAAVPFFWTGRTLQLLSGIRDAARYFKVNVIFFQGYYSNISYYHNYKDITTHLESHGSLIFDLVNKSMLDGIIINTGTLRTNEHKNHLLKACSQYEPLPVVSIGSAIDGITNILIDNVRGIRKLMNHLIQVHKYRTFGLIRGPDNHSDSRIRTETFIEVLQENNIPIDYNLISKPGSWYTDWVCDAACSMLKYARNKLDAILTLSDLHSRVIIEHFRSIGIRVPEDISVVGFNNSPDADRCRPAITTIDLNLYDRGWYAIKTLNDFTCGKPMPESITVNAPIIIRQSCGCPTTGSLAIEKAEQDKNSTLSTTISTQSDLSSQLKLDIMNALSISESAKGSCYAERFMSIFFNHLEHYSAGTLICNFSSLLHQFSKDGYDISKWYWAINCVETSIVHRSNETTREIAQLTIDKCRVLISEFCKLDQQTEVLDQIERNALSNSLGKMLNGAHDLNSLLDILSEKLPHVGITTCYLSIYTDCNNPLDQSRLILAYNQNGRIELPEDGILFPTMQLIPNGLITLDQCKPLIIEPLFYGDQQLGFTLFEFASQGKSFYELFTVQLSTAIWGSILFHKEQQTESMLKAQAESLTLTNEKLHFQAHELKQTLEHLKVNRDRLLLCDKMAILGRLTANIAHEMNTPLASVRASMMQLRKLIHEFKESINDPDISKDDHREIAHEICHAVNLAEKSASQATDFIKSIRIQSCDTYASENEFFNLTDIIVNVLVFLSPSTRKYGCVTQFNKPELPVQIYGSPSKMTQIITNIITNAVDAVANSLEKIIRIDMTQLNSTITMCITDTGCGIPVDRITKIFDPMFSTKPFVESSGLGLAIVHDLITTEFKGSIEVESEPEKGTTFTLTIPVES